MSVLLAFLCPSQRGMGVIISGSLKVSLKKMTGSKYIKKTFSIMGVAKLSLLIRIKSGGRKATLTESLL